MDRLRAAEEPSLPVIPEPFAPSVALVVPVASMPIVELSLTSGSGMLVSIVGRIVFGIVLGKVGLLEGMVAGSLLVQPQAAQDKQIIAAAKIAINRFILTS